MATEKQGQIYVKGSKILTTAAKEIESHCKLNSTAVKTKVRVLKGEQQGTEGDWPSVNGTLESRGGLWGNGKLQSP